MQLASIKRSDPDRVFAGVRNMHTGTLVDGDVVKWLTSADSPPAGYTRIAGVDVNQTGALSLVVAGAISAGANGILQGDYGFCQVYGLHPGVKTTVAALAAGTIVTSDAAGAAVAGVVGDDPNARMGVCITLGAGNKAGIFLRCM